MPLLLIAQRSEWIRLAELDNSIPTADWLASCCKR